MRAEAPERLPGPHIVPSEAFAAFAAGMLAALPAVLSLVALMLAAAGAEAQTGGQTGGLTVQAIPIGQPKPAMRSASGTVTPDPAPEAAPLRLPVNAKHVVVLDERTGQVLMARNPDAIVPIASLTKLMTAMVVLDARQDPNEQLRIGSEDVDLLKHSRSFVQVGARLSRRAALEMALMASENRAASVLARHFPGGESGFRQAVQAKIKALGLRSTSIEEPTGLSPANTSTAAEVAAITTAAARYPEIARITSGRKTQVAINGQPRELRNTNRLVGAKGWDIRLSKTGYTEEAGRCLAMRMMSGARAVTVVLLDADGSAQRLRDAALIRKSLAKG